jgi:thymidylate synthase ThyX
MLITPGQYAVEEFTDDEARVLLRYFSNIHLPVFAISGLPEVVTAALFARYSRTSLSLRRLFLDEFYGSLAGSEEGPLVTVGLARAKPFLQKVFFEYGDDSVAQLGGVHLACEQASNVLTKVLEWSRLAAYLEQSTRYISYADRVAGYYRYYRDPEVMTHPVIGPEYQRVMDLTFETYAGIIEALVPTCAELYPRSPDKSERAHRQAMRAKALDNARGLLPAATVSNLGIYATGQAFENMLVRMRSLGLPEARSYADMMLAELRTVIPSFMERVDIPSRGVMSSHYLAETRNSVAELVAELLEEVPVEPAPEVTLLDWDPDAEEKLVAAIMAESSHHGEAQVRSIVTRMSQGDRLAVLQRYFGDRSHNRRHKPGRQLELPDYRFEVLSNYGAFRDLQRHRMLTITWQLLTPMHGYEVPALVKLAGAQDTYEAVLEQQAALYHQLAEEFPVDGQPQYALGFAWNMRYTIGINARALTHMLELRTQPAGHVDYRRVCQQMHRLIAEQAGHTAIAAMMQYVDHGQHDLGRLAAEERLEAKRLAQAD